jgi:hypothetical protein
MNQPIIHGRSRNEPDEDPTPVRRRTGQYLLVALLVGCAVAAVVFLLYPGLVDFRCAPLLIHSVRDAEIPLPGSCSEATGAPSDSVAGYLENDRTERALLLKKWIVCGDPGQVSRLQFTLARDPRWLPGYVPDSYQFRRTVVIIAHSKPASEASHVVAVVCLLPWRKYISQIGGQCDAKFSVWR